MTLTEICLQHMSEFSTKPLRYFRIKKIKKNLFENDSQSRTMTQRYKFKHLMKKMFGISGLDVRIDHLGRFADAGWGG